MISVYRLVPVTASKIASKPYTINVYNLVRKTSECCKISSRTRVTYLAGTVLSVETPYEILLYPKSVEADKIWVHFPAVLCKGYPQMRDS